ncbi:MAG: hypothetical protein H7039_11440, partial [Bryobacteraceae bacterium]|nr:hypothetical protein [Bryobacteraceae bacterium]
MPTNLLILPLLGGYWLVHHSHRYRFRTQHFDGYRLLLDSGLAGAMLLMIARAIILLLKLTPAGMALKQGWDASFAPGISYLGTGLLAALLGLTFP